MQPAPPSTLFDRLPIGAYRCTATGHLLRANPALVALHGADSEAALLAWVNQRSGAWYAQPQRQDQWLQAIAAEGAVTGFESELLRLGGGDPLWVRETADAVRDAEGRLLYVEGTLLDIAVHIGAHIGAHTGPSQGARGQFPSEPGSALGRRDQQGQQGRQGQQSQQSATHLARLERAEVSARVGSWEHDLVSGAVWWSAQMYLLAGSREGEGPVPDLRHLHPDDRMLARQTMDRAIAQRLPQRVLVRSNPKRGPVRWFSASGDCQHDSQGRPQRLSGTLIDVTALVHAEQALRELNNALEQRVLARTAQLADSERRYRRIFEALPVAIVQQDWAATLAALAPLRALPPTEQRTRLLADTALVARCLRSTKVVRANPAVAQLLGMALPAGDLSALTATLVRGRDPQRFIGVLLALLAGQPAITIDRPVLRPDGSRVDTLTTLAFPAPGDTDTTVLVSMVDVSELKRLSAALDSSLARVTHINRELETFTYSVAHDLKAPLRGIDGYSQLLLQHHAQGLDDEGRGFLQHIRNAAQQMGQLIDDLLAYSRLERRPQALARLPLAPVVAQVLASFGDEFKRRGIPLPQPLLADAAVLGDAQGLVLALRNLVDNALKFTAHTAQPQISVVASVSDAAVLLAVSDNGIGFDMALHGRIFEIFQRLQRADDYPGNGVGLAIVRKAMDRMGGRTWAESAPGRGAVFYLELPRA